MPTSRSQLRHLGHLCHARGLERVDVRLGTDPADAPALLRFSADAPGANDTPGSAKRGGFPRLSRSIVETVLGPQTQKEFPTDQGIAPRDQSPDYSPRPGVRLGGARADLIKLLPDELRSEIAIKAFLKTELAVG